MAKVVAIMGGYRRGGVADQAVDAVLEGARERGAETKKIYLSEQHIEFCRNCRSCSQQNGLTRGKCPQQDDMECVLGEVEDANSLVLGSPVNYYNVTAIFRRFMERLLGFTYWPWGRNLGPKMRSSVRHKNAVLVCSAGMPGPLIPIATGAPSALKLTAKMLGASPIGKLWIGLAAEEPEQKLPDKTLAKALRLGRRLA